MQCTEGQNLNLQVAVAEARKLGQGAWSTCWCSRGSGPVNKVFRVFSILIENTKDPAGVLIGIRFRSSLSMFLVYGFGVLQCLLIS